MQDPVREPARGQVELDELHLADLAVSRNEVLGLGHQRAAVEDEQQLVALLDARGPIDGEQSTHRLRDAELFREFTACGLLGTLTRFDVSPGDVPARLVCRFDEQHPAGGVPEEDSGSNAGGGDTEFVGHDYAACPRRRASATRSGSGRVRMDRIHPWTSSWVTKCRRTW